MKDKKINVAIAGVLFALPLMSNGMFLALAKKSCSSFSPINRRMFSVSLSDLRKKIETPQFTLAQTRNIISRLSVIDIDNCDTNLFIEHIVFKATEHRKSEKKYAEVLGQLRDHGLQKSACCANVMLHSAVISDLPSVTQELLQHDFDWVHKEDFHNCVPIDYAQSPRIIKMLKDAGSRDAIPYTGEDKWYRVPGYGWQEATELRQAVYNGNLEKYSEIVAFTHDLDQKEAKILKAIADLRYWRTRRKKYLMIKKSIRVKHSKSKEKPYFPTGLLF